MAASKRHDDPFRFRVETRETARGAVTSSQPMSWENANAIAEIGLKPGRVTMIRDLATMGTPRIWRGTSESKLGRDDE
ncbi:MAG: hypothetical protein ACHREM_00135 [Polyangiales bacterium]